MSELECISIEYTIHLSFKATNNEAEYEALLARLCLARSLNIEKIHIYSNSQLIIRQVTEKYQVRDAKMHAYLKRVKALLATMKEWTLTQIPCAENEGATLLAKMASASPMNITRYIPIELLHKLSIKETEVLLDTASNKPTLKDDIVVYLLEEKLLEDRVKAHKL